MHILHVASEAYPFSRTGGLADVMAALPAELARLGHQASVLSPWYADIVGTPHEIWRGGNVRLGEINEGGVRFLFLETPAFKRPGIYHSNDVERFSVWGRLVLPVLAAVGIRFDVLHGHDWAAGLVVAHAKLRHVPSVFTIHNLQYQGRWNIDDSFGWTGLPEWVDTPEGVEFYGDLNLMKAGLVYAGHVTTVSPTYAKEITTPEFGEGLEGVLQTRLAEGKLSGVINGLDQERWNPRTDGHVLPYGTMATKEANIAALRQEFHLDDAPILSCVARLATQKGLDILLSAMPEIVKKWNLVLLGSGDTQLETAFSVWAQSSPRVRHVKGMNESLSHRLYAGAHAFAMPSRFEPCGLSQMIALRYGTPPVARRTGGLADTVPGDIGFLFDDPTPAAFLEALGRAEAAVSKPKTWNARAKRGLPLDFSWKGPAKRYLEIYQQVAAE
ncbi:glycogen synthase [Deinococcus detaillensis]|uniref:Glycogen synthase n=1 Tax=Deinococcus detaillensis TaxID=2592048 RepID=A0A553V6F0_9DEIO|nr:glycogen/starch synthase [Deinococcus detaillensis]TSA88028.1 glycogen synthase [Deinococcus detaillensis]